MTMQPRPSAGTRHLLFAELAAGGVLVLVFAVLACGLLAAPASFPVAAVLVYVAMALTVAWHLPAAAGLGAANRVTLGRGLLVCLIAASLVDPRWLGQQAHGLVLVASLALAADGLDGWVARRTATASAFGARFDMELDAFLILLLCFCVLAAGKAGAWIFAIGAMRYVFVAAMWPCPWLAAPLPESRRRKVVCVWQVASLLCALSPWVAPPLATPLLASALLALALSFAVDVRWLYRMRA
jgi:phosphatidylglycerophosphate synthase